MTAPAETYHLSFTCGADPYYRRRGIRRDPLCRLKRLLKFAKRECGFDARWATTTTHPTGAMISFENGAAAGQRLMLKRAPLYLRVVFTGDKWDALDQLTDTPAAHESIAVYVRIGAPSECFLDWTQKGRRRGARFACATYRAVPDPPDDATLRNTEAWREWCRARVRATA